MNETKISAYLGFCIKAGKLVFGVDNAERLKGGVYLLLVCRSAGESTQKQAKKLSGRFHCPLLVCEDTPLAELIHRPNCKFAAVRDKNLAEAVLQNADHGFGNYSGGKN